MNTTTPYPTTNPAYATTLTDRFRQTIWPWLAYIATFAIFALQLTSSDGSALTVLYIRYVAAITVALQLFIPRKPRSFALRDALLALILLALPVVFTQALIISTWPNDTSFWLPAIYLISTLVPCVFCISLAALIAAVFAGKPLQWVAVLLAPIFYLPWWFRMMPAFGLSRNIFLYEIFSLLVAFPAAIAAWILWKPQAASTEFMALSRLNREILRKEVRLQKNNIFFTIATVLLGMIGLVSINAADPSVASFNPDDIRDALTYIIILPLLTLILPLMIGSTAAAGEKPMGVQAWQSALPISHWHVTLLKFTVITGMLIIVSVVLPFLFALIAADTPAASSVFRHTSPVWLAILCAAIGYYSGTLARDDYQGLLISIVPIALLILAMTYADPLRLVFPAYVGWAEPIMKQHILAARLLIIAALFILGATRLQRLQGRRIRIFIAHTAVLLVSTFVLTLANVVWERQVLSAPDHRQFSTLNGYSQMQGNVVLPRPILTTAQPIGYHPVRYSLRLETESQFPNGFVTGTINRSYGRDYSVDGTPSHPFIIMSGAKVREFPQAANARISGISPGGNWILTYPKKTNQRLLCGPAGIIIHSDFVPKAVFDAIQRSASIPLADDPTATWLSYQFGVLGSAEARGSDLIVNATANTSVLIKDGALLIPHYRQRWYGFNYQRSGFSLKMVPQNDDTLLQVALLEPLSEDGQLKITGVVNDEIKNVSSDGKWAQTGTDWKQIAVREVASPKHLKNPENADLRTYMLPTLRSQANGTTVSVDGDINLLQVIRVGNADYLAWPYKTYGPVTIGNRTVAEEMWLGQGALVLNLKTGAETLVPFDFPWSVSASSELLNNFRNETTSTISWQHTNVIAHPAGPIAASQGNSIIVANPFLGKWVRPYLSYSTTVLPAPGVNSMAFLTRNEIIATDSHTLYQVSIPDTRYPELQNTGKLVKVSTAPVPPQLSAASASLR